MLHTISYFHITASGGGGTHGEKQNEARKAGLTLRGVFLQNKGVNFLLSVVDAETITHLARHLKTRQKLNIPPALTTHSQKTFRKIAGVKIGVSETPVDFMQLPPKREVKEGVFTSPLQVSDIQQ